MQEPLESLLRVLTHLVRGDDNLSLEPNNQLPDYNLPISYGLFVILIKLYTQRREEKDYSDNRIPLTSIRRNLTPLSYRYQLLTQPLYLQAVPTDIFSFESMASH